MGPVPEKWYNGAHTGAGLGMVLILKIMGSERGFLNGVYDVKIEKLRTGFPKSRPGKFPEFF
jgi:hypothetical protein